MSYNADEFEKLFLEKRRQQGLITALEEESYILKADLLVEQRARNKAVLTPTPASEAVLTKSDEAVLRT